jgi:hypothetical protein
MTLSKRWYQRVTCDDDHEVWLLSWLPGRTGFHDHGANPRRRVRGGARHLRGGPRRATARARRCWCPAAR